MRSIQILFLVLVTLALNACGDNVAPASTSLGAGSETTETVIITNTKIDCKLIDSSFSQVGDTCVSMCVQCLKSGGACDDTNHNGYGDTCVTPLPTTVTPTDPPKEVTPTDPPTSECEKDNQRNLGYKIGDACMGNYGVCKVVGTFECVNAQWTCSVDPKGSQSKSSDGEICGDNLDNDCNGQTDEGCGCKSAFGEPMVLYVDADDDGFGTNVSKTFCVKDVTPYGYATQSGDCNDENSNVHPGAAELCNSIDDNCDGVTDSGCNVTVFGGCYKAHSAEIGQSCSGLYGVCAVNGVNECGWSVNNTVEMICSTDVNGSASKMVDEICGDGLDNDCDGATDNGCVCPDVKMLSAVSDQYANYCNKCSGECKTLPNIPIDASSFKLVVILKDLASEDKLFAITEYIPNFSQNLEKVSVIVAGTRVGVIDLDPKTTGIWYAICNVLSSGGCTINPVQTSKNVTEFFPGLADQVFLIKNQQWIDLTAQLKPALSKNSSVHGEIVTW